MREVESMTSVSGIQDSRAVSGTPDNRRERLQAVERFRTSRRGSPRFCPRCRNETGYDDKMVLGRAHVEVVAVVLCPLLTETWRGKRQ